MVSAYSNHEKEIVLPPAALKKVLRCTGCPINTGCPIKHAEIVTPLKSPKLCLFHIMVCLFCNLRIYRNIFCSKLIVNYPKTVLMAPRNSQVHLNTLYHKSLLSLLLETCQSLNLDKHLI